MTLRYLSVCSGIEAATQAWRGLGWKPVAFSEIEPFPCAVLAHHYPDTPNWGDMTKFKDWPDAAVDVLCGGTPCQAFSVAGLRQGLADPRGNLMLTFGAIAGRYRPRWLVWENVPGVLSSNSGRDFGTFLGMLGQLGYGVAYRVLDAQYIRTRGKPMAVPQRRRRVFVVAYLGDWRRAAAVLFDRESLSGHPAPRREAGERPAPTISARPTGGGGLGTDFDLDGGLICAETAPTLDASFHDKQGLDNQHINGGGACSLPPVSHCLNAGGMGRIDYESETFIPVTGGVFDVAHSLRGEGFDASEDGTGRGTPLVAMAFDQAQITSAANRTRVAPELPASTFSAQSDMCVAIQERAVSENLEAGPGGAGINTEGAAYTLEARNKVQAVAFAQNQRGEIRTSEISPQLTTGGGKPGEGYPAVAFDLRGREGGAQLEGPHDTANIRAADGGSSRSYVAQPWAVRRLTPRECERLQGFPDDFTKVPGASKGGWREVDETEDLDDLRAYGMPLRMKGNVWMVKDPDGPRYKALGNSWAVNVAEWVGERIAEVDAW